MLDSSESMELDGSGVLVGKGEGKGKGKGSSGSGAGGGIRRDGVRRGWDWRDGLARGVKGQDVIGVLRVGLAKELARTGW